MPNLIDSVDLRGQKVRVKEIFNRSKNPVKNVKKTKGLHWYLDDNNLIEQWKNTKY